MIINKIKERNDQLSRLKKDTYVMILIVVTFVIIPIYLHVSFDVTNSWWVLPFFPATINLYLSLMFQKRFEEVTKWKEQLDLSIEDLRRLSGAQPYEIHKWVKKDLLLSWPKMSKLADNVEQIKNRT